MEKLKPTRKKLKYLYSAYFCCSFVPVIKTKRSMKKIKQFCFFVLFSVSLMTQATNVAASDPNQSASKVVILHRKSHSHRPQAPARNYVECIYSAGNMQFTFPPEVTSMFVEISEGDVIVWQGIVTLDEPSIVIPTLYGEYVMTCITDEGTIYSGILNIDDEIIEK